jgi:hypothetical protein
MPAITFPASPYQYQVYTVGSKSWQWDGSYWVAYYNESPDIVYGNGYDGDKTLDGTTTLTLGDSTTIVPSSSVYSLTRDVYFNDLTINASVRIAPNGYRLFVKNILKLNNNSIIGYTAGYSTAGSIQQGGSTTGSVGTSVTCSLGGNAAATYTATAPTAAQGGTNYFRVAQQAVTGYSITASGSSGAPTFLRGGAGGTTQAGGGVVIVAARYISGPSSGTGYIKAPATSPGGGGVIIVVSSASALPASISTDVTGANAGTSIYIQQV